MCIFFTFFFYFLLTIFLYSKWVEFLHLLLIISSITQTCYHLNFSRLSAKPPKGAAVNLLLSRSPNQAFSHNNPWKLFLSSYLWPHCCKIQWSLAFSPYSTTYSSDHSLSSLIYFFSFGSRVTSISCFSFYLIGCMFSIFSGGLYYLQLIQAVTYQF